MSVVIGIDPSINYPGYAVFNGKELVEYGVTRTWTGKKPSDQGRLRKLLCDVGALCYKHSPKVVVVEDYQFRKSDITEREKNNLKKMIWAIGVCVVSVPSSCELVLLLPKQWKGSKSKGTTIREAKAVYKIDGTLNNNAADAIMIAHHYIMGGCKIYDPTRKPVKTKRLFVPRCPPSIRRYKR